MNFDESFNQLILIEGGYSDHPHDLGGKTAYGITEAVARANGYTGQMVDMSIAWAEKIYRSQHWDLMKLDDISNMSYLVAHEMFDTGVNMGNDYAAKFLQRSLNCFNRGGTDYHDIAIDNIIGPMTLSALKKFLSFRGDEGERVLLKSLDSLQGARYVELSEIREKNESFTFGWFSKRVA